MSITSPPTPLYDAVRHAEKQGTSSMSSIVPLASCMDSHAGGKATHLSRLASIGLRVPEGFVVIGASPGALPADIDEAYAALGGPVAVRSSAQDEDGEGTWSE